MEHLIQDIGALLSQLPRLTLRSGRDAWLTSLPRSIRDGFTRAEDVFSDLLLILDSALPIQLRDGQWAVLVLLDEILPDMLELADGPKLRLLRDQIEVNLKSLDKDSDKIERKSPALTNRSSHNDRSFGETISLAPDRQRWLTDLEFAIDPFAYLSGAQDPNILRYYYRIPNFYDIVGDTTKLTPIFVFGAAGSGKSSLRNAVAQMCRHIPVLPVVYRILDSLVKINLERTIQRSDHVALIIIETFSTLIHELEKDQERAKMANRESTRFLRNFIWNYAAKYVTMPPQRHRIFTLLNPDDAEPRELSGNTDERELLGNLCAAICEVFNYQAIYFLVDPDPISPPVPTDTLWTIIKPLLDSSSLLDLAHFKATFKFFLDDSLMDRSLVIEWIALNRTKMLYTLTWTSITLRHLLRERLRLSSNKRPPHVSLGEISEANDLDDIVVSISAGSPRQLIAVCNRLLLAHLSQPYDSNRKLITRIEIDQVLKEQKRGPSRIEAVQILDGTRNLDPVTLQRLIWQGENELVEFKSSLRYNLYSGNRDVKLEQIIAQEICGFANTRGGFLILGIDNDGNALGLENDYKTLGKERQNEDGYRLAVTDIITSFLDRPPEGLRIQFEDYSDKRVCVISVVKNREPLYCIIDQKAEIFIRLDNSARKLDARQILQYVKGNFEKY